MLAFCCVVVVVCFVVVFLLVTWCLWWFVVVFVVFGRFVGRLLLYVLFVRGCYTFVLFCLFFPPLLGLLVGCCVVFSCCVFVC